MDACTSAVINQHAGGRPTSPAAPSDCISQRRFLYGYFKPSCVSLASLLVGGILDA